MTIVRPPHSHELDAFANCADAAFALPLPPRARERFLSELELARSLACFEDGELVATFASTMLEETLPGPVLAPVAGWHSIAVSPGHQRQGLLVAMMRRAFEDAHQRDEPLASLVASSGSLYGRFGFGVATWSAHYGLDLPAEMSALRQSEDHSRTVRLLRAGEAAEVLPAVFDLHRRQRIGEIARAASFWDEFFDDAESIGGPARLYLASERDGEIDGYLAYEVSGSDPRSGAREIVLVELCGLNRDAELRLWRVLVGLDVASCLRTLDRPVDEPIRHALVDQRALRVLDLRDGLWLRLIDAKVALSLRRYGHEASLVLDLSDDWCPWNNVCLALSATKEGSAVVEVTERPADLVLDAASLAAIFLGATSVSSLVGAGRIHELSLGAAGLGDKVFGVVGAPFASGHP